MSEQATWTTGDGKCRRCGAADPRDGGHMGWEQGSGWCDGCCETPCACGHEFGDHQIESHGLGACNADNDCGCLSPEARL